MTQKERMLAGLPYRGFDDELVELRRETRRKIYRYNQLTPDEDDQKEMILRTLLGVCGKNIWIEQPLHCDYGTNIEVGDNFYANYNLTVLDVAKVKIGNNVLFAPNVSLFTAGPPVHPESRNSGYEYGFPITIGNNVWVGGNSVILPNVTIGDNVVIGAGSVVTKNIPSNVVAAGNPCRVLRAITEEDRDYYFKDLKFDIEDYK